MFNVDNNNLKKSNPDNDYSYLDDDDVYEEYLEPNQEIEIDEDEEVEIIEILPQQSFPPPPFGAFPPRFGGRMPPPPPPPPPFAQVNPNFNPSEIEMDDGEVFEYEVDSGDLEDSNEENDTRSEESTLESTSTEVVSNESVKHMAYSEMVTPRSRSIAPNKEAQEQNENEHISVARIFFKVFFGFVCLSLMVAMCYAIIYWNHYQISKENSYKDDASKITGVAWRLPNSISSDIIRRFFESLGNLSDVSEYRDMMVKGTTNLNNEEIPFYCIRRANGVSFIKLGSSAETERAYYAPSDSHDVFKLLDLRINGARESLPQKEALVLRALVLFDDHIFKHAFGDDVRSMSSNAESFKVIEKSRIGGEPVDVIVSYVNGVEYKYYFSVKDSILLSAQVNAGDISVKIDYSDYKETDINVKFPYMRKVYINGKPIATVTVKIAIRNKGFILP